MKQERGYYTAQEVRQRLGITEGILYNTYVRTGRLKRYTPPGKKYGVYNKEEVDDLQREMEAFIVASSRPISTSFAQATPDDMPEMCRLVEAIFGTYPSLERWTQWIIRNPETCWVLKAEGKIIGCALIQPLTQDKIADILAHQVTPPTDPSEIGLFVPGVPLHLYIRTVGVQPGMSTSDKRLYGSRLISNLIKVILDFGKRGIAIQTITSRSETPDGIRILRHMGFTEIPTQTNNRNFIINVASSGIPAIEEYKTALAEWQREQDAPA